MAEFGRVVHHLSQVLASMRSSLERSYRASSKNNIPTDSLSQIAGELEKIRFKISSYYRKYPMSGLVDQTFIEAMNILENDLKILIKEDYFSEITRLYIFRVMMPSRSILSEIPEIRVIFSDKLSVFDVAVLLRDVASKFAKEGVEIDDGGQVALEFTEHSAPDAAAAIARLKRIVPEQKLAPVQFSIENDRIKIEKNTSHSLDEDKSNINFARDEILKNGDSIIDSLRSSNCDKRLLKSLINLQNQIMTNESAVKIGISNISCGMMSDMFKHELPDAVSGMLKAHNLSVGMYVAQFPDWNRFSENAAAAEIERDDIKDVASSAQSVISYLEKNERIAEPEVIKAFRQLREIVADPAKATKRAAFAVIRTIENLISKLIHYAIKYFEKTANNAVDELAKATSKFIVGSLVALAIAGSASILNISSKINELSWIKSAIEIVQRQMRNINQ